MRHSLEFDSAHQLDVAWSSHASVPFSEIGAADVGVEWNITAEGLVSGGEIVHVESVERFGADQEVYPLCDPSFLAETEVKVLICKTTIVGDALAGAIVEVERRRGFKRIHVEQRLVGIEVALALQERILPRQNTRNARGPELS